MWPGGETVAEERERLQLSLLERLGTGLDLEEYPERPARPPAAAPKGETEGDSMAPALPF